MLRGSFSVKHKNLSTKFTNYTKLHETVKGQSMNRIHEIIFRFLTTALRTHPLPQVVLTSLFLCACFTVMIAQTPSPSPTPENPFAPEKADPLSAGMTGSDVNDPRAKLSPGFDNAGEAAMGLKHVLLVQK